MSPQQALQILINLSNNCVSKGGIFDNVGEAATANMALNVVDSLIKENTSLSKIVNSMKVDVEEK